MNQLVVYRTRPHRLLGGKAEGSRLAVFKTVSKRPGRHCKVPRYDMRCVLRVAFEVCTCVSAIRYREVHVQAEKPEYTDSISSNLVPATTRGLVLPLGYYTVRTIQ